MEIYNEDPTSNLVPFPHLLYCIALLSKRNAKLAICTQKLTKPSIKILKKLNIYHYFDQFAFGDTLGVRKPDPRMINYIIQNDQPDTSTVYIGDSEVDSETAKNAKVRFILFSKGYRAYKKFLQPGPFVSSLERDSPGRAGIFIGYRIVKDFMNKFNKLMGEKKASLFAESLKKNILNKLRKHGKNARELINTINFIFERKF